MFVETWTLTVDEGQRINITFLHFSTETCCDFVVIENERLKTYSGYQNTPFTIITNTNNVDVTFSSDNKYALTGFLAIWSQYNIPTECNNCDFPFTFGDTTFDTCISVQDVDTQPWCPLDITPPVFNTVKITCPDSDSSCPSSPPLILITLPNYPLSYPNNVDQVK